MFERFESLSRLYVSRFMIPTWEACGDVEHDPWSSVKLFLRSYGYERQGRAQDYSHAAADTVDEVRHQCVSAGAATAAWQVFSEKLDSKALNHRRNPLCPAGTKWRGGAGSTWKKSVVQLAAELDQPLVTWARNSIQDGNVKEAWDRLQEMAGIGWKITSFFLRDVALRYALGPRENRELLQPVDTWVQFVVRELANDQALDYMSCARHVVASAKEPERVNGGIWYFCAVVAGSSRYVVRCCLKDKKRYGAALARHLSMLEAGATAVHDFRMESQEQ